MWRIMFWIFLGFGLIGFQPLDQGGKAGKGGTPTFGIGSGMMSQEEEEECCPIPPDPCNPDCD